MPDSRKPDPGKRPEPPDADPCDTPLIIDSNGVQQDAMQCAGNESESRRVARLRRRIDPDTCERDYTDEEIVFMKAMDAYKRKHRRPFPTWSEVLDVLKTLGYHKAAAS